MRSLEDAIMGGIVLKGKKEGPKDENKVKTKVKKTTYIRNPWFQAAKMKAETGESKNREQTVNNDER